MPLRVGQILNVKIEGIGSFGEGLARVNQDEIFVPKTAPLDEVEIEILEQKKGRYRAKVIRLLSPSSQRIAAKCQHFESCGGCDFQHLPYDDQLAYKLRQTKHWVRRSPLGPVLDQITFDTIASTKPYHYRSRVRLQVKNQKLHFFKPHSNELLQIQECPILEDQFFEQLADKAKTMNDTKDWNQSFDQSQLIETEGSYQIDGCTIRYQPEHFTQANREVNELMWARIKSDLVLMQQRIHALDLFCGVGNFTLPMKKIFDRVTGVELSESAIDQAKKNSSEIEFFAEACDRALLRLLKERRAYQFILMDPPRAGAWECLDALIQLSCPRITYVSCSLESLVRDLSKLVKKGGYRIERWTVVDLFSQTHHIESIVSLVRA